MGRGLRPGRNVVRWGLMGRVVPGRGNGVFSLYLSDLVYLFVWGCVPRVGVWARIVALGCYTGLSSLVTSPADSILPGCRAVYV